MNENNITKIGLTTPEDIIYDDSYTKDILEWLDNVSNSLDDFFKLTDALRESENNAKTLTWFEYESL